MDNPFVVRHAAEHPALPDEGKNHNGAKQLDALQRNPVFIPERGFDGFPQTADFNE